MKKILIPIFILLMTVSCGRKQETIQNEIKEQENHSVLTEGAKSEENTQTVQEKENTVTENRKIGDVTMGFIDFPEDWEEVPQEGEKGKEINKDNELSIKINTVHVKNSESINLDKIREEMFEYSLKETFKTSIVEKRDVTVNGYSSKQIYVEMPDENIVLMNFIQTGGRIYYVEVSGPKERINEAEDIVDKSWKPRNAD